MWIITNFGFFSVVEKPNDKDAGMLTIRSRVKSDLVDLKVRYLPSLGEISSDTRADYKWRARASREAVADAMQKAIADIGYSNFKSSVGKEQGRAREALYHDVWSVLYKLQSDHEH